MNTSAGRNENLSPVKQALLSLETLQKKVQEIERAQREPIAIVGIGCRFPGGADTPEAFWQLLCDGKDAVTEVPGERWDADAMFDADPATPGKMATRWGAFLDKPIDAFDCNFFNISPREATYIDPQQRLLLEVIWEALENSGQNIDHIAGSQAGVFVGVTTNDYLWLQLNDREYIDVYTGTGNAHSIIANRISHLLDLHGPSLAVDTACSSSLVAFHLACQSLRNKECSLAITGGVSLILTPELTMVLSKSRMMASDGRCKTFDTAADGFVRGEGCGAIILKRASDAIKDGDTILALVRGSAINQDGRTISLTAPNSLSQEAVIRQSLENAQVQPEQISYVETHGTGTALGDPIEVEALTTILGRSSLSQDACILGALKTNIGHLEAAAGIAGLIKVILAFQHETIPPNLHFSSLNPNISLNATRFVLPVDRMPWPSGEKRRFAGVSAFGFGGTNAHVILEEAPPVKKREKPALSPQILLLSARTRPALEMQVNQTAQYIQQNPEQSLANISYTLQVGRKAFTHNCMLVCSDGSSASQALTQNKESSLSYGLRQSGHIPVYFLFPGQGTQYKGMAKELYQSQRIFRKHVDHCAQLLQSRLDRDIRTIIFSESTESEDLSQTWLAQPVLFTIEYALAKMLMEWGIKPSAMLGHSIGEYVAACLANVFSLEDALAIVSARGLLMQQLPHGAMMAISCSSEELANLISSQEYELSLSAINAPMLHIVAGSVAAIQKLQETLSAQGREYRLLHTSHAFHSHMMEPIVEEFLRQVQTIRLDPPDLPYISNVTGNWITPEEATSPSYWVRHLRQTVRFSDGVSCLLSEPNSIFLEVGPGRTLGSLVKQCDALIQPVQILSTLRHPRDSNQDDIILLSSIGRLWQAGVAIDWKKYHQDEALKLIALPTYPFERQRYWATPAQSSSSSHAKTGQMAKSALQDWFYLPSWKRAPLPHKAKLDPLTDGTACWLLFLNDGALEDQLVSYLQRNQQIVITAKIGTHFTHISEKSYLINPLHSDDYLTLMQELEQSGQYPQKILHLWSLNLLDDMLSLGQFDHLQWLGFYSLLFIAQALDERRASISIKVAASNVYAVVGDEQPLHPEYATLSGPCQVIPQEYPHIHCQYIDLSASMASSTHPDSVELLIAECIDEANEQLVAYRGGHRWIPFFEKFSLEQFSATNPVLQQNSVYLVTGGLGGIGLELASYLVQQIHVRLILIGRSYFPPQSEWELILSKRENKLLCQKIQKLQSLEDMGAELLILQADVTNEMEMQDAIARSYERFGQINGVIHAAGIAGGGAIQLKTHEMAEKVLAPKIKGAIILAHLFQNQQLDFLVFCSSIASTLGAFGQVDYSAANAFLDAFAWHLSSTTSIPTLSINWDAWSEVGMAVDTNIPQDLQSQRQEILKYGIRSDEGREAFGYMLQYRTPQILTSTQDFQQRLQYNRLLDINDLSDKTQPLSNPAHRQITRPDLSSRYVAPQTHIEQVLAEIWQDLLGIEPIGIYDNFFDLGGHSLLAIRQSARIRQALAVELPMRSLFDATTVAELALQIEALLHLAQNAPSFSILDIRRDEKIPLSFAQQRLWFLDQFSKNTAYSILGAVRLRGTLSIDALKNSLQKIIDRHEILRTTFCVADEQPLQIIVPALSLHIPLIDLTLQEKNEQDRAVQYLFEENEQHSFDLAKGPLVRAQLIRLDQNEHILLLTMHHIISDAWSTWVFFRELMLFYTFFSKGEETSFPHLPIQYADYTLWQRQQLQGNFLEKQINYWRKQLANAPAKIELPTDYPRPPIQSYRGSYRRLYLPKELISSLHTLSQSEDVTLFMTLLAAFQTLLCRITGQTDILVGTPIANRPLEAVEHLIGLFTNTLVMRTDLASNPSFRTALGRVRETALEAYNHQDVPFEKLVEILQPERDLSHSPLFQTMLVVHDSLLSIQDFADLHTELVEIQRTTAKFDLTFELRETFEGLEVLVEYSTDLFEVRTIDHLLQHWQTLLYSIVEDPDQCIGILPLLTPDEQQQILRTWNATERAYPSNICLPQLFEERAKLSAQDIALSFEGQTLTYADLNARANQLAHFLKSFHVNTDMLVGVYLERSCELVIALLAVLKAGGAYVPLDPRHPVERLSFQLLDAAVTVILTQTSVKDKLPISIPNIICFDTDWERISTYPKENIASVSLSTQVAYTIYTSGSTGKPKGVQITHRSLINFLLSLREHLEISKDDCWLAVTTISFDIAALEIFLPLIAGACVQLASPEVTTDGYRLAELLQTSHATIMQATPATWRLLLAAEWRGQNALKILCGGEALPRDLALQLLERGKELWNLYGPTETTIWSTLTRVGARKSISLGQPIANTQIYVLDEYLQLVPVGVIGELYIGGDGLARGYLNQPALTAERFIPDPFSQEEGTRLYRTGDLVRYRSNGHLEYLRRNDFQVKIRGYRIELGEIEEVLRSFVEACVVIAREDVPGDKYLAAYVIPLSEKQVTADQLRRSLQEKLPEYMLPSSYTFLQAFPLTPNGKINRLALPKPEIITDEKEIVMPRTPLEEVLATIWTTVLGREKISMYDNFFAAGGHSLLATLVITRIRTALQLEIPLRLLFEAPTISALAEALSAQAYTASSYNPPALKKEERSGAPPLSFAQQRLWFLQQVEPGSAAYNMPGIVRLYGKLHYAALKQSLNEIVRRHEVLRTSFAEQDGEIVQIIHPEARIHIPIINLEYLSPAEQDQQVKDWSWREAYAPFDLRHLPILRVRLLSLSNQEHVILITAHHIAFDGWSVGIFFRELTVLYTAYSTGNPSPLNDLAIQYADYASWQRDWLQGEALEQLVTYWRQQLAGIPTVLNLPTDGTRSSLVNVQAASYSFSLSSELCEQLQQLAQKTQTTMFILLLSAFQVLLYRWSGQKNFIVGTDIANRSHQDMEDLIGFFVNILAIQARLSGTMSFTEYIHQVRETILGAYAHQMLPFEKLVEALHVERAEALVPLIQVLFVLQNTPPTTLALPELTLSLTSVPTAQAKFDLAMFLEEKKGIIEGTVNYRTDLFSLETIDRFVHWLVTLLQDILIHPNAPLDALQIHTEAERESQKLQEELFLKEKSRRIKGIKRKALEANFAEEK